MISIPYRGKNNHGPLNETPTELVIHVFHLRYYAINGLMLIRIVSDPWMMAMSKSQKRKYWYHTKKGESSYVCPRDALTDFGKVRMPRKDFLAQLSMLLLVYRLSKKDESGRGTRESKFFLIAIPLRTPPKFNAST